MKKIAILPMIAVAALGLAACSKTAETTNTTTTETNTVIEESDANFSAVDGPDALNEADLINSESSNTTTNTL